jgi:predicted membrane protein
LEAIINQIIALADGTKLAVLVALIAANFFGGLAVSLYAKNFQLKKVGDFLLSRVIPYILGYFVVVFLVYVEPSWQIAIPIVWGIIVAALVGAILTHLKELGLNLPDILAGPNQPKT